ncbi:flagellar biosynthesis protein FlhB [bacterium]|nr:flagellar biosynthesis protein FlhB [bacterium]|tara:strand:- start:2945 stop:4012 length:1068 start_codon:yes stop_codon:yes gene_type:complete
MGEDSGEKTEEPTPHKLSELRKKGQISKSKDFTSAVIVTVAYLSLKIFAPGIYDRIEEITFVSLEFIAVELTFSVALYLLGQVLITFFYVIVPLLAVNLVVAIIVEFLQVGPIFSIDPLTPNIGKLNPIEGFKKMFALKQLVELFKSILKMGVVIWIIFYVLSEDFILVLLAQELTPTQTLIIAADLMFKIIVRVAIFYLIIAILDLFYQRAQFMKQNKMSKKEIKDEYKRLEGDPLIKQRQRETQMQMSQGRQMGAVPDADVVVTNPVFIAIAIQYKPNKMVAPKIIAKGKRLIASDIRKIAEEHFIPIVENPPLARNLYDSTEAGSDVPPMFYKAVAQILAFVYKLKQKKKLQ